MTLITCQNCQNLMIVAEVGICTALDRVRPMVNALRQCDAFSVLVDARDENDAVNHPQHYTSHSSGIECIEISENWSFCLGNALKYLWRSGKKDGEPNVKDLEKAKWYIEREIIRTQRGVLAAWRNIEIEYFYDKLYLHYLKADDRRFFSFVEHIIFGKKDGLESALKIVESWIEELSDVKA